MGKSFIPFEYTSTDDQEWPVVLEEVRRCASTWEPRVRLLGNVRAGDIVRAIEQAMAAMAATPSAGIGRYVCDGCGAVEPYGGNADTNGAHGCEPGGRWRTEDSPT